MGTLAVRNEAQRILFVEEIAGQISDGAWENARPFDHWIVWCDADVIVDPDNVGRDFYARKDNYGITRKDLLDIVGERMLGSVLEVDPFYTHKRMLADLRDLKVIMKTTRRAVQEDPTLPAIAWKAEDAEPVSKQTGIPVKLIGTDGNAFSILGKVRGALSKANVPQATIDAFMAEATAGDYNHLLRTAMEYVEVQ